MKKISNSIFCTQITKKTNTKKSVKMRTKSENKKLQY